MSAADATYLVSDLGAAESGVAGAVFHGQLLQAAGAAIDLYVSRQAHDAMGSVVVAVADPLGSVVVRIVCDEAWREVDRAAVRSVDGRLIAPPAAVALDLMESGDARHWVAAENLVGADG